MKYLILILFIFSQSGYAASFFEQVKFERQKKRTEYTVITTKPVYHHSFTEAKSWFGVEFGLWNQGSDLTEVSDHIGADFGFLIDFDGGRSSYLELQVGGQFCGFSTGPFYDFGTIKDSYGLQYTLWVNFGLGTYFRAKQHFPSNQFELTGGVYVAYPGFRW